MLTAQLQVSLLFETVVGNGSLALSYVEEKWAFNTVVAKACGGIKRFTYRHSSKVCYFIHLRFLNGNFINLTELT